MIYLPNASIIEWHRACQVSFVATMLCDIEGFLEWGGVPGGSRDRTMPTL